MKYSETTLQSWVSPLSAMESSRVENTIKMIKDAINASKELSNCEFDIFLQGSYANNTNVRQNSDVDVCVMLKSTFFSNYATGMTGKDYDFTDGSITYGDYKNYILDALKAKFEVGSVTVGNKSIQIKSNTYHVNADVVPAFQYRDYKRIESKSASKYIEGIKYIAKDRDTVINYPKDHIANGTRKNNDTNHYYKQLVRIMKHIRNNMVDDGKVDKSKITSFLVECLVWNVPNNIIAEDTTWGNTVRSAIAYLWKSIDKNEHEEWGEVSERLYLFRGRKWKDIDAKAFLQAMWNFLEFE